ncbi:DNA glycosylase [Auriculariales sp. MPI-PUGE-AT-0066]|nr:DNA glycosylase [Auriculariales sp. MPI-PUGE-AT-0066]
MPTTRAASTQSPEKRRAVDREDDNASSVPATPRKRARVAADEASKTPRTPRTPRKTASASTPATPAAQLLFMDVPRGPEPKLVPASLSFGLNAAKAHLISFDPRFKSIMDRRACWPYEQLSTVDPFRTLASSIISQQIATKAARSITHKFCRMYDSSLPEKYEDGQTWPLFPTATQVAATPLATLRTAGLSARKAEYIFDLATHFSDGRVSTDKLLSSNHEQLLELLLPIRGIGPWTVEMFSMFSMRNPDILPTGDLGVQRGLARWALAAHSPKDATVTVAADDEDITVPTTAIGGDSKARATTAEPDAASILPAPDTPKAISAELPETPSAYRTRPPIDTLLPQPITPSIARVLKAGVADEDDTTSNEPPFKLPEGLSLTTLRARASGKAKIKGAILSPTEMEALTEGWKPYRSIGVFILTHRSCPT